MPKKAATRLTKKAIEAMPAGGAIWDVEIPGFGVRATDAGTKSYILMYRYRPTGQQRKMTLGRFPVMTVEQARIEARRLKVEVEKGSDPANERKRAREARTVADYAEIYCGDYAHAKGLAPRTVKDASRLLRNYALPKIGKMPVADVVPSDVRYVVGRARDGSGRYEANRLRAVLSRMFKLALQDRAIAYNPCSGVDRFEEDQRWVNLKPAEVSALLRACDECPSIDGGIAIKLLVMTGARLQELLKAEWNQFDLDSGMWEKPSRSTKTKRQHRVPLAEPAIELLRKLKALELHHQFLFPGRDGTRPRSDLKRPWEFVRERAGLVGKRLHDLRRTMASHILSSGEDLATVGRALGHTQPSTTARYAQLNDKRLREGVNNAVSQMLAS